MTQPPELLRGWRHRSAWISQLQPAALVVRRHYARDGGATAAYPQPATITREATHVAPRGPGWRLNPPRRWGESRCLVPGVERKARRAQAAILECHPGQAPRSVGQAACSRRRGAAARRGALAEKGAAGPLPDSREARLAARRDRGLQPPLSYEFGARAWAAPSNALIRSSRPGFKSALSFGAGPARIVGPTSAKSSLVQARYQNR